MARTLLVARAMRAWPTLALAVLVSGCFDSHGTVPGDAGPGRDGGPIPTDAAADPIDAGPLCDTIPSAVTELACPSTVGPGETIVLEVTHGTGLCCGVAGARATASTRGPRELEIVTSWDACDCCEACECLSPPVTSSVMTHAPETTGPFVVRAGDRSCEIDVVSRLCERVDAHEVLVEPGVEVGAAIPLRLARFAGAGCGCVPRAWTAIGREGPYAAGLEVCDCSAEDLCVDAGYAVTTFLEGSPAPGRIEIATDVGSVFADVIDPATCRAPDAGVWSWLVVAPPTGLVGSRDVWVRVDLSASRCCGELRALVSHAISADRVITLSVLDCTDPACACGGDARRWQHWHHVGELPSGTYEVVLGPTRGVIEVP